MTFEEYATTMTWSTVAERTKAKAVWKEAYKQGYKDSQATIKQMEVINDRQRQQTTTN